MKLILTTKPGISQTLKGKLGTTVQTLNEILQSWEYPYSPDLYIYRALLKAVQGSYFSVHPGQQGRYYILSEEKKPFKLRIAAEIEQIN